MHSLVIASLVSYHLLYYVDVAKVGLLATCTKLIVLAATRVYVVGQCAPITVTF